MASTWLSSALMATGAVPRQGVRMKLCVVCRCAPIRRNQRCVRCANYRDRTGQDRPIEVRIAYTRRVAERVA